MRIYADPEVRISYDGDVPHMEAPIAASASDPNTLYAASEVLFPGRSPFVSAAQIYTSRDGGVRWSVVPLAAEARNGGWDNALAAARDGVAYFITHDFANGLVAYRTDDSGVTWTSSPIPSQAGWDREYAVVDNTTGRYSGRLYVEGEGFLTPPTRPKGGWSATNDPRLHNVDGVKVVSSSDGGRTFSKPVMACHRDGWAAGAHPFPVVLSDGTLVVTCSFYPIGKAHVTWSVEDFGVAVSTDGGRSFSGYRSVGHPMNRETALDATKQTMAGDFLKDAYMPPLAVAPQGGMYAGRLYIAWSTFDTPDREVIYVAHSDDLGVHWSAPRAVDATVSTVNGKIREAVPMLAVNKDGIVGISWYDARNAVGASGYDIYFSASTDGGDTFLTPVRVTSKTSHPQYGGRSADPYASDPYWRMSFLPADWAATITFLSPYNLRYIGGDYATMAADAAGRFHPMWPDARDGTWQLYTSTIHVLDENTVRSANVATPCDLSKSVHVVLGVPQWDPKDLEVRVSVQLQNLTGQTILKPLAVDINSGKSAVGDIHPDLARAYPPALVFDEKTGTFARAATVVYPISVDRPLFPNGVTVPMTWRFSVKQPEQVDFQPSFRIRSAAASCPPS